MSSPRTKAQAVARSPTTPATGCATGLNATGTSVRRGGFLKRKDYSAGTVNTGAKPLFTIRSYTFWV